MELILKDSRRTFQVVLVASICMIGVAFYMENFLQLEPCILCYMQRGAVIGFGVIAALGIIVNPKKLNSYRLFVLFILIFALIGASLAIRQLYLQSLPDELVPSCAPDMEYLFDNLPFLEILILAFTGDGNCSEVLWTFLGISIPGWVLIGLCFVIIYCLIIFKFVNQIHSHNQN